MQKHPIDSSLGESGTNHKPKTPDCNTNNSNNTSNTDDSTSSTISVLPTTKILSKSIAPNQQQRHFPNPLYLNDSHLTSPNYLSTNNDCLSPSVLLSPVLTRPVRSLSALSPSLNRTLSVGSGSVTNTGGGTNSDSDFDSHWMDEQVIFRSRNNSRASNFSDSHCISSHNQSNVSTAAVENSNLLGGEATLATNNSTSPSQQRQHCTSAFSNPYPVLHATSREGNVRKSICSEHIMFNSHILSSDVHNQPSPITSKVDSISSSSHTNRCSINSNYNISDSSETFISRPESVIDGKYINSLNSSLSILNPNDFSSGRSNLLAASNYNLNNMNRFNTKFRRRPSIAASSITSLQVQHDTHYLVDSPLSSQSTRNNLQKMRLTLGHSDPQISSCLSTKKHRFNYVSKKRMLCSTPTTNTMGIPQQRPKKERKSVGMHHQSSLQESAVRNKMNITAAQRMPNDNIAGSSNVARCKSPVNRVKMRYPAPQPNKSPILAGSLKPNNHRLYNPNLNASFNVAEHRRWSLASLPSSSGYGTPGSNSALSSQYSSQEQINELFNELRINSGGRHVYDVGEGSQDANDETIHRLGGFRPRSRSLSSPVCFMSEISGDIPLMSTVFKERFPKAKSHMEELLMAFIQENVPLSGLISSVDMTSLNMEPMMRNLSPSFSRSVHCETPIPELSSTPVNRQFNNQVNRSSFNTSYSSSINSIVSNRRSVIVTASESLAGDPTVINLVSDGATRFIHHQIVEIASDILQKSKDDVITSNYFVEMTCRLEGTLDEAKVKVSDESYHYLTRVVRELLMVISRPARLLECLEFDPGDFYQLLEEAEGVVRNEMSETQEKTHDMPQYILGKLGLDKKINEGHLEDRFSMKSVNGDQVCDGKKNIAPDKPKNNITPCETDFDSLRLISNGAYGAVYLVRHKVTRQRFALKKMKKQTLILRNQVDQVYAERDILTFTDNPFVVSFFGSFETKTYLCMLLEYVEGGDCASLLKSAVVLPLELARLYIAETILAIEYLHSYGIVHRDLKPDNLLITAMGHIKLTDFGLSKIGLMNRTTLASEAGPDDTHQFKDMQLCGTPDYIAPEVIIRQGYGKPVDWWALGIMLYEFLVGCVPFCGDTPDCLFANIIKDDPEFPEGDEGLDSDGENLIKALLEKNPNDRIGTYGGAVQVSSHAFFSSLNFNTLLRQKAEFVPNLEGEDDTSYFDTRCDRYNHEPDSGDEENSPMFCTFNTATPRHSICAIEIPFVSTSNPSGSCVTLPSIVNSSSSQACDTSFFPSDFTSKAEKVNENEYDYETSSNISMLSEDSSVGKMHFKSDKSLNIGEASTKCLKSTLSAETPDSLPSPTAVILRKKFSAQRHLNSSTSSGSTNYTGCVGTTTSSTDSSVDASNFTLTENSGAGLAHYYRKSSPLTSPLPRFSVSNYSSPLQIGTPENVNSIVGAELSPVAEVLTVSGKREMICEDIKNISATSPSQIAKSAVSLKVSPGKKRSPNTDSEFFDETLKVVIPTTLSNTPVQSCSYQTACQLSPGAGSVSSASSFDSNSPNISKIKDDCCAAAGTSYLQPNNSTLPPSTPSPLHGKGRTVTIKKGPRGYGFTVRSVRVYVDIILEFYRIEHIIDTVIEDSPAELAGLVTEEFITHVNNMPVRNLTHPDLQRRLLNSDNEIHLRVLPMSQSSIREVPGRREVGQMIKKLSKKTSKHSKLEKKTRKPSSLFRRLSGKRGTNDIVPGSSTQKQTFMPRSVSSQDGILLTNNQPKASTTLQPTEELWQKEKITESTPLYTKTISSVETLTGSIIAVSSEENSKNSSPKTKSFQKEIPSIMKTSATIEPISKIIHKEMPPITEGHKLETPKPSTKPEPTGIVGQLGYLLGNKDRFKPFQQQTKSLPIPPTNPSTIPTPANESYISRLKRSPNATRRLSAAKLVVNRFLKNNTDNT